MCSVWNEANGTCDTTIVFIQMNRQNGEFISNLTIWSDEVVRFFVLFVRTWRRWQQQVEDAGTRSLVSTLHFTFLWNRQLDIIIDQLVFTCSNNLRGSRSICAFHLLECNQIKSESTARCEYLFYWFQVWHCVTVHLSCKSASMRRWKQF